MVEINYVYKPVLCYFPLAVVKHHDQCSLEKKGLVTNAEGFRSRKIRVCYCLVGGVEGWQQAGMMAKAAAESVL